LVILMPEWRRIPLGTVVSVNPESTPKWPVEHVIRYVDIASVSADSGIDGASVKSWAFGEAPGRARRRIRSGDVLVSTVRPNLRAFAPVPQALDGEVASTGFAVLRARDDVLPGFVWAVVRTRDFVDAMIARCTGSNYPAIRPDDIASYEIALPSLREQTRIVDLIGALDGQTAALDSEAKTVGEVLHRFLDQAWDDPDEAIPVGSVANLASGPSWAAADERSAPEPGTTPVVKITNTRPDGRLDLTERLYVKSLASARLLDDRSLIAIRTNGNRERIGNVYLPNDDVFGSAVSAFQFIVLCQSSDNRDYLYWVLRAPRSQRVMSDAASGSTGLGNMGARWLRALEVPWPDVEARTRFVQQASATAHAFDGLLSECESLRVVRSTLLTSLLSGEVVILESYDALLTEAV
jgi:type I restriction enzyme, S subunit